MQESEACVRRFIHLDLCHEGEYFTRITRQLKSFNILFDDVKPYLQIADM